jgi:hypothetical protein
MGKEKPNTIAPVRREHAGVYLLSFLVAFSVTVIATRVFLRLTGYPQLGNDTLHIAHALWGGLLLIAAALLPLVFSNSWALQGSAVLGGVGVGLFIDEVGKFLTQSNDYFFAPALPLIYGFFLVCVILYHLIRETNQRDPRHAMYQVLDALKEVLDRDLDAAERSHIEERLAMARRSTDPRIAQLAEAVADYLRRQSTDIPSIETDLWARITAAVDRLALRLGRRNFRAVITVLLIVWTGLAAGSVSLLLHGSSVDPFELRWRWILIGVQVVIGVVLSTGLVLWLTGREGSGLDFGIAGFLLSLVALQTLYFYLSQFSAVTATILQFLSLQPLLIYRRVYVTGPAATVEESHSPGRS